MTKHQANLLATFQSLPPSQRSFLELLSVVYQPVSRRDAQEFAQQAGIRLPQAGGSEFAGLNVVVRNLIGKRLLIEQARQIQCDPRIVDALTRSAGREGRLQRWLDVAQARFPQLKGRKRNACHFRDQSDALGHLRIALHLDDAELFSSLMAGWSMNRHFSSVDVDFFRRLAGQPFDGKWLCSRDPAICESVLGQLVRGAHLALSEATEPSNLLHRIATEPSRPASAFELALEHDLLAGNVDEAEKLLSGNDTSLGQLYCGALEILRGDSQAALAQFEGAVRRSRKATGKREVLLPVVVEVFYVLALIASGDRARNGQARRYADLAARRRPAHSPLYQALSGAAHLAEGSVERIRTLGDGWKQCGAQPPLFQLFIYAVLCWVDEHEAKSAISRIGELASSAQNNGYAWAASELNRVLDRISDDRNPSQQPSEDGAAGGLAPLFDTVFDKAPWEQSLLALERFSNSTTTADGRPSGELRMTWRVQVVKGSLQIDPFEQTLGKSGRWSKGKSVSLELLYSGARRDSISVHDSAICAAIERQHFRRYDPILYRLRVDKAAEALVGHPLVFRFDSPGIRVEVVKDEPQLRVTSEGDSVRVKLVPEPPDSGNMIATAPSQNRVVVCLFRKEHRQIINLLGKDGLVVPAESMQAVTRAVSAASRLVTVHSDFGGDDLEADWAEADSTPQIHLTPHDEGVRAEPFVVPLASDGPHFRPGKGGRVIFAVVGGQRIKARRSFEEENRRFEALKAACPALGAELWDGMAWIVGDLYRTLDLLEQLQALGDQVVVAWPKGEPIRLHQRLSTDRLAVKVRKAREWFEIDGTVELDEGLVLGLRDLLEHVRTSSTRFVPLGDNGFVALTERFRLQIEDLAIFAEGNRGPLRAPPARVHAIDALFDDAGSVEADDHWAERVARIRQAQLLDPAVPSALRAELREYQAEGFRWAARLAAWGTGACLADDMGLGKTVQALAVAVSRAHNGPALVVAPTSVCSNWIEEAQRFAPSLKPIEFGPGDRRAILRSIKPFDLVVCSYGLLHQESDGLVAVKWETVVLDEAQAIKNRQTLRSRAAMRLHSDFRMITTATPIENRLGELWNLFHFINPGLLGSVEDFSKDFAKPVEVQGSSDARNRLKRLIGPFILRRTKAEVLHELPEKTEITQRVEMTREERALYEAVRQSAVEHLERTGAESGSSHVQILAEIMKLRRACCHPRLVLPETDIPGSKLARFSETAAELIDNGHRALVFSQFTSHLDIVQSHLDQQGVSHRRLDGALAARERKREADAFQAGDGNLFLISLRAGGHGLNLTAADYVIHLDPWWNPAVEDQASDRAHRIGQTKPVTIYRLVMRDTIEEKIVELHASKRDLADSLLAGTDMSGKMSAEELLALIKET